ncbi:MAG TPA: hypothetical protein VMB05_03175 [Solirubrobacteraceae bacterium]|nr:hypothetical protein [Solirubrobacteraceae bacterium]
MQIPPRLDQLVRDIGLASEETQLRICEELLELAWLRNLGEIAEGYC